MVRPPCTLLLMLTLSHPSGSCIWWLFRFTNNSFALSSLHGSFFFWVFMAERIRRKKWKEKKKIVYKSKHSPWGTRPKKVFFVCVGKFSFLLTFLFFFYFFWWTKKQFFSNLLLWHLFFVYSFVTLGANENEITAFHVERKSTKHSSSVYIKNDNSPY